MYCRQYHWKSRLSQFVKFLKGGMTIEKLLAFEEFPEKLTGILSALVKSRYNILISGATNSGKSSLLNALAEYIAEEGKSNYDRGFSRTPAFSCRESCSTRNEECKHGGRE